MIGIVRYLPQLFDFILVHDKLIQLMFLIRTDYVNCRESKDSFLNRLFCYLYLEISLCLLHKKCFLMHGPLISCGWRQTNFSYDVSNDLNSCITKNDYIKQETMDASEISVLIRNIACTNWYILCIYIFSLHTVFTPRFSLSLVLFFTFFIRANFAHDKENRLIRNFRNILQGIKIIRHCVALQNLKFRVSPSI
jgi:hypothetical protein